MPTFPSQPFGSIWDVCERSQESFGNLTLRRLLDAGMPQKAPRERQKVALGSQAAAGTIFDRLLASFWVPSGVPVEPCCLPVGSLWRTLATLGSFTVAFFQVRVPSKLSALFWVSKKSPKVLILRSVDVVNMQALPMFAHISMF